MPCRFAKVARLREQKKFMARQRVADLHPMPGNVPEFAVIRVPVASAQVFSQLVFLCRLENDFWIRDRKQIANDQGNLRVGIMRRPRHRRRIRSARRRRTGRASRRCGCTGLERCVWWLVGRL